MENSEDSSETTPKSPSIRDIMDRFKAEGRWYEVEPVKDRMIKEARERGLHRSEAQAWAYAEIDRLYPAGTTGDVTAANDVPPTVSIGAHARGVGQIPENWPKLPGNASQQAELAWVQAERLRVVEETASGATVVHLDRASTPAPSMAALGWLETSVRSYAKYVDVVARTLATQQDEQQHIRRERMAIEDIRALLREMREAAP